MDHQNGAMYPGVGAPHAQSPARPSFFPSGASSPATPNPNSGSFAGSPTPHSFADPRNRYQNPYLQQAADGAAAQGPFNGAGGFAVPSGAPNGNMMPSQADGGGAFVQPQPRQPQGQYTSAPQQQPGQPAATASAAQKFANVNKAPPSSHVSPYSTSVPQQPRSEAAQVQPMAAPMSNAQGQQPMAQTPVKGAPMPPASPGATAREKERVSLLLEINSALLQEIFNLQSQGKGGAVAQPAQEGKPAVQGQQASKEYIEVLRRLQVNLHYLAACAERAHKPNHVVPQGPAIMTAPPSPPAAAEMYTRLQGLFPGWRGGAPLKVSPGPNRPGGNPQGAPPQGSPQSAVLPGQAPPGGQPS